MRATDLLFFTPLANHLWQSTVFVGVIWLLTLVLKKNRAAVLDANARDSQELPPQCRCDSHLNLFTEDS